LDKLNEKSEIKEKKEPDIILDNKKDPYNSFNMSSGFSIGIKTNNDLNLRKKRKEEYLKNTEKVQDFGFFNILKYNQNKEEEKKEKILCVTDGYIDINHKINNERIEKIQNNQANSLRKFLSFQKR
jgi:hypothetical protein